MNVLVLLVCGLGLMAPAIAQADTLAISADAYISARPADLIAYNAGGQAMMGIGGEDVWSKGDYQNGLLRWDLSSLSGKTAISDATITLQHSDIEERTAPRNFSGQSLDLYLMPANNADWVEGTGSMDPVAGVAWNRKKGDCTTTPPDADKWLPAGTNLAQSGISLVDSITWTSGNTLDFTVPMATINAAISDGAISLLLRSDSVQAALQGGDPTQRLWFVSTREGTGNLAPTLAVTTTPEPSSIVLVVTGVFGLLAYAWRKRN